jgi:WD40 repeat protein
LQIWKYKQGSLCAIGKAKAGPINGVQYSPNGSYVVAITDEGAILVWFNHENGN